MLPRRFIMATHHLRNFFRRSGRAAPLIITAALLPPLGGFLVIGSAPEVGPWLRSHGLEGMALFWVVYTFLGTFALVPTYAASLLVGWAFGFWGGLVVGLSSFVTASVLCFFLARWLAGDELRQWILEQPRWRAVYEALFGQKILWTTGIVTLLRAPPNSPFAMSNVALSVLRVPLIPFFVGTFLGMLPRTAAVVLFGSELSDLRFDQPMAWWYVGGGIALLLLVFLILGAIVKKALERTTAVAPGR